MQSKDTQLIQGMGQTLQFEIIFLYTAILLTTINDPKQIFLSLHFSLLPSFLCLP